MFLRAPAPVPRSYQNEYHSNRYAGRKYLRRDQNAEYT
jgi:hypothetical protein